MKPGSRFLALASDCGAGSQRELVRAASPRIQLFTHFYLGESCVNRSPTVTPYYFSGAIGNPSTTEWLYLDCPMDRAIAYDTGWVDVIDQNGYTGSRRELRPGRCALELQHGDVLHRWHEEQQRLGTQKQSLSFGVATGAYPTVYYYSCGIPPAYGGNKAKSYIETYSVSEPG